MLQLILGLHFHIVFSEENTTEEKEPHLLNKKYFDYEWMTELSYWCLDIAFNYEIFPYEDVDTIPSDPMHVFASS